MFGGLVGAYLSAPVGESGLLQRADTSVGPYRGSNVDLCLGGVAIVWSVQRAGHAPPLQGTDVFGILMGLRVLIASSGRGKPRPYEGTGRLGCPVGAHLFVRPWTEAEYVRRADT